MLTRTKYLYLVMMTIVAMACSGPITPDGNTNTEPNTNSNNTTNTTPKSVSLSLTTDSYYELGALWVNPQKSKQLQEYFKKAGPYVQQYKPQVILNFGFTEKVEGDLNPSIMSITRWPDAETPQQVLNDENINKLFPLRDGALTRRELLFMKLNANTEFTLNHGDYIEVGMMWVKPEEAKKLKEYGAKLGPLAKKYGVKTLATFTGVSISSLEDENATAPNTIVISKWPDAESARNALQDPEIQKLFPLRDAALSKLRMSHFTIVLAPPNSQ